MRTIILTLSILLSLTSCSDDDKNSQDKNILGTWKLIESKIGNGADAAQWTTVDDGYTYTFNEDGAFYSTRFSGCMTGRYELSNSTITLDYDCPGFDIGIENPSGTFIENYVFENENIILTPSYMNCDEGCSYKFVKIEE